MLGLRGDNTQKYGGNMKTNIVINNGEEVVEALKQKSALGLSSNVHITLVEPSSAGEVDMDAVRRSMKNHAKFIVNHWHDKHNKEAEQE